MAEVAKARVHLEIRGRVQGVFFRAETADQAVALGLKGWVRNRRDGSVEVVAEGEKDRIEQLLAWCRQGPTLARVSEIAVEWFPATGEFHEFRVAYSA